MTHCLVWERVQELLKDFPPYIEDRTAKLTRALDKAKRALRELLSVVSDDFLK